MNDGLDIERICNAPKLVRIREVDTLEAESIVEARREDCASRASLSVGS